MVTKTAEEWDLMSPAEQKAHLAEEEKIVYGHDFKTVKGHPVEQGIGSPGRETNNHFAGIRKYEGDEAYQAALADIWKRDPDHAEKLRLPKPKEKAKS